jgi:hypothetical protein
MRYMMLVKSSEKFRDAFPPRALMEAIGQLAEKATKDGTMIETGGLAALAKGAIVRQRGGKITVIDGPFTEAKEVVGGYAIFEFPTREAAIESARVFMELHLKHWPEWEGETEVRPYLDPADFARFNEMGTAKAAGA